MRLDRSFSAPNSSSTDVFLRQFFQENNTSLQWNLEVSQWICRSKSISWNRNHTTCAEERAGMTTGHVQSISRGLVPKSTRHSIKEADSSASPFGRYSMNMAFNDVDGWRYQDHAEHGCCLHNFLPSAIKKMVRHHMYALHIEWQSALPAIA